MTAMPGCSAPSPGDSPRSAIAKRFRRASGWIWVPVRVFSPMPWRHGIPARSWGASMAAQRCLIARPASRPPCSGICSKAFPPGPPPSPAGLQLLPPLAPRSRPASGRVVCLPAIRQLDGRRPSRHGELPPMASSGGGGGRTLHSPAPAQPQRTAAEAAGLGAASSISSSIQPAGRQRQRPAAPPASGGSRGHTLRPPQRSRLASTASALARPC